MNTQQSMLYDIMLYDFAVQDSALFLDTHPDDKDAFAYYKEASTRLQKSKDAYQKQFGALDNRSVPGDSYSYVRGQWPWEGDTTCGFTRNDYNFQ